MAKEKKAIQTSLFKKETNLVSIEEFKTLCEKNVTRKQHEKKLMNDLMDIAKSLGLPCIHIEHFCGNKFYPTCSGPKYNTHKEVKAICPICKKTVLAHCLNRINKKLAGNFDIIGIAWAIETKHKVNKGKQNPKLDPRQKRKKNFYKSFGVPYLVVNESGVQKGFDFLRELSNKLKTFFKGVH